jgi:hypothetical protein
MNYVLRNSLVVFKGTLADCQLWIQNNKQIFNEGDVIEIAQVQRSGIVSVNVVIS